ncbi:hypothetical protein D9M70_519680 [compost metagenome]
MHPVNELGNSLVKHGWNHTIDRDLCKHGACKWRILEDGDAIFLCNFTDFEGNKVLAHGHDDGRVAFLTDITQRDRVVSRVGDHQCGTRHGRDHPLARPVTLHRTQARFDDRVALGLLHFLLHLLLGHHQFGVPMVP